MNRSVQPSQRAVLTAVAVSLAGVCGCGEPTEDTRQNRRLVEAVLTAVTMENRK